MGYSYGTYHFYGVHVPREQYVEGHQYQETDRLDRLIQEDPTFEGTGLGHITAGDYDRYELFLCVVPDSKELEVELGRWRKTNRDSHTWGVLDAETRSWDQLIEQLASAAGYELDDPGWITIPYCF